MLTPLNSYLLVEPIVEETTNGGLYIPQTNSTLNSEATNILKKAKVIESNGKLDIKNGSIVYYNKYAITNVPDNKDLILVRAEDLYMVETI